MKKHWIPGQARNDEPADPNPLPGGIYQHVMPDLIPAKDGIVDRHPESDHSENQSTVTLKVSCP